MEKPYRDARAMQVLMLLAMEGGALAGYSAYGSGRPLYGGNVYDNLERQGTKGNYRGSRLETNKLTNKASQAPSGQIQNKVKFGSNAKSANKLNRQMNHRGWTNDSVLDTINEAFTTRKATNRATGNSATVYYNKDGSHVIIDDVTGEIVQVSDRFDINWKPDDSITDPYLP